MRPQRQTSRCEGRGRTSRVYFSRATYRQASRSMAQPANFERSWTPSPAGMTPVSFRAERGILDIPVEEIGVRLELHRFVSAERSMGVIRI